MQKVIPKIPLGDKIWAFSIRWGQNICHRRGGSFGDFGHFGHFRKNKKIYIKILFYMDFEHWMKDCLKCGCPTSKIICRPCFDAIQHEPEISGFLKSEEQVFIEVRGGFIGFFCNNAWVLPKVKVKLALVVM